MSQSIPFRPRLTVTSPISLEGIGLHSGLSTAAHILPGESGLRVLDAEGFVPLCDVHVSRTPRCTRLVLPSGRSIDMVEHLLAALRIAGITDADIRVDGDEVPVLDGSSAFWLSAISDAHPLRLDGPVEYLVVTRVASLDLGQSRFRASAGPFSLDCTIDFPNEHIGRQRIVVDDSSVGELGPARTFVLDHEIAFLKENNLALGGSLDNAVVIGSGGPLNPGGFRTDLECARHKALDFLGDLMVKGVPIVGAFEVFAPGHSANNAFLCHLLESGSLRKVRVMAEHGTLNAA